MLPSSATAVTLLLKVIYLAQSGFAILGETATIVIDYYSDSCIGDRCLSNGVVDNALLHRPGRFYVLCSHGHADHFNPVVLSWRKVRPDIVYLFSYDLLNNGQTTDSDAIYADETLQLSAFDSTDIGISFVLKLEGKTLFHAGDLNNWHWNEEVPPEEAAGYEAAYLAELEKISTAYPKVDAAFFPVDPRLGKDYMRGAQQFVDSIDVGCFIPMHFGTEFSKGNAFARFAPHRFIRLERRGDSFLL